MKGYELEALRKNYGLSIDAAASVAGVTGVTWGRWESGKYQPDPVAVKRFAIAMKGTHSPDNRARALVYRIEADIAELKQLLPSVAFENQPTQEQPHVIPNRPTPVTPTAPHTDVGAQIASALKGKRTW